MNDWDHLPNAKYIDAVIASLNAHPHEWNAVWNAAWVAAWDAARNAVWDAARNAVWNVARNAAWDAARNAVWNAARDAAIDAARGAILALIAYDDCAYMLESDPGELAILAAFGDQRAILLLPACKAFAAIKNQIIVDRYACRCIITTYRHTEVDHGI